MTSRYLKFLYTLLRLRDNHLYKLLLQYYLKNTKDISIKCYFKDFSITETIKKPSVSFLIKIVFEIKRKKIFNSLQSFLEPS